MRNQPGVDQEAVKAALEQLKTQAAAQVAQRLANDRATLGLNS